MTDPTFGIKTTPVGVTYDDVLRVWQEADAIPAITDAWLWDHLVPIFGPASAPVLEGWTLLTALAARTERLRMGLLVTNNRTRSPSVLAKIAATVDVISGGRLVVGLGVGATDAHVPGQEFAVREFQAYGLPLVPPAEGREALAEACTILRRMWSEEVFDFHGRHYTLTGAVCEPKPIQQPGPPLLLGAWGDRTLRVVAEHADIWNVPGPPHYSIDFMRERSAVLDRRCADIGRDPAEIVRSTQLFVSYDDPASTRETVERLIGAGFAHLVLSILPPYPDSVAAWVADEIIRPVAGVPVA
ncbi:LLM class flavin-dependent oxidoreductase [Jiangella asiatica]|uniref:LLM class flavin-dependent oxidoreductase n=1 Tax=Jiangella asiatica TaxID=2530372 RepID=A0A4R5CQY9_9ACTN|nr:LLM class flavin-dependent oxidoreductase [Jiangella asiatica]TDE02596.1 LLM class flavin-dependent oxidoreductase [Jiangella asiatica]